jgi:hypothetical protein
MRTVVWFSCGAPSACAAKLATKKYENVVVAYCDVLGDEHPDNERFIGDVENWIGQDVVRLKSKKYSGVDDVISQTRYIVGVKGSRCSTELKKVVRHEFEQPDDIHVFGYTLEESKIIKPGQQYSRCESFERNNPELTVDWILIENCLTKKDCLGLLWKQSIKIPKMYLMGYSNNNCIGCVKGQMGYWNKIRKDFPEVFWKRARQEREIGATINKRYVGEERIPVYLDELPENVGNYPDEPDISCGISCGIVDMELV